MGVVKSSLVSRVSALALLPFAFAAVSSTSSTAEGPTKELTITVTKVKALDKADELSKGDFFARVTVGTESKQSEVVSGKVEFKPDWKLTLKVPAGDVKVKFALIDKDVAEDDPIDINRVDKKRDLDFTVNTGSGKIEGFSQTYKVGQTITRGGKEPKKAEVSFKVSVK